MVAEGLVEGGCSAGEAVGENVEVVVGGGVGACDAGVGVVAPQAPLTTATNTRSGAIDLMWKYYGTVVFTLDH